MLIFMWIIFMVQRYFAKYLAFPILPLLLVFALVEVFAPTNSNWAISLETISTPCDFPPFHR